MLNNPVAVSLLSGDRKPQIRFLGNHPSGSGNLYHKFLECNYAPRGANIF